MLTLGPYVYPTAFFRADSIRVARSFISSKVEMSLLSCLTSPAIRSASAISMDDSILERKR